MGNLNFQAFNDKDCDEMENSEFISRDSSTGTIQLLHRLNDLRKG